MNRLLNEQYTKFILEHVVRPYQGMLGYEKRIERLMFAKTTDIVSINYADLIVLCSTKTDWFDSVVSRISRCYEAIDFSFFPNEAFAQQLQKSLLIAGVRPVVYFDNCIYANTEY